MIEANQKLDNLETLAKCASKAGKSISITIDEDGYYIIDEKMFVNYAAALKFIVSE